MKSPPDPLAIRENALRDIKAVHTRWYRGEISAEKAVTTMEAIAVSVWQREYPPQQLAEIPVITTPLARTEDAENDRLYDQWNKKERHD